MVTGTSYGIALDVDGVLVRDAAVIQEAFEALDILQLHRDSISILFVTNGGSITEEAKAEQLSTKLGINVSADQVILSHTPLRRLAEVYADQNILVIGGDSCVDVARSYGFQKPICPSEYHRTHHSIYPSRAPQASHSSTSKDVMQQNLTEDTSGDLAAVFVLGDSMDWGLDMQVMTDALLGNEQAGAPHIPVYACNADIVYTGRHPKPRFTQGAFVHAFKSLFEHYSTIPVNIEFCGKPFPIQYEYAEALLQKNASNSGIPPPTKFFGIGDNPKSDIRGANAAGGHWRSVLVCSGVYQGGPHSNDQQDPADFVVQGILEAVRLVVDIVTAESSASSGGGES